MLYQVQNMPYNLTTEHGRAQSYAHSEQGAFLVGEVERALEEQEARTAKAVELSIDKELANLNPIDSASDNLLQEFSIFQQELGKRDAKEFAVLLAAYSEERQVLHGNIALLTALVNEIKTLVGIREEQDHLHGNE